MQRDDGSVLTEYEAISIWLALTHPEKRLIPPDVERHVRMMEALEYVVGTIHASGFRRVFRPMRFTPNAADHDAVKAEGLMIAKDGLAMIDKGLADKDFIVGDFSIADPALFYVTWWAVVRLKLGLPANVQKTLRTHDGSPCGAQSAEGRGVVRPPLKAGSGARPSSRKTRLRSECFSGAAQRAVRSS